MCLALCAGAGAQAFSLSWQAPAECATQAELRARLAQLGELDGLSVAGSVQRQSGLYVLELEIASAADRSSRSLRARSCETLEQSVIWLVELARTPGRAPPSPAPEPPSSAQAPARAPAPPVTPAAPSSSETRRDGAPSLPAASLPSSAPLSASAGLALGAASYGFGALAPTLALSGALASASASGELQLAAAFHPDLQLARGASIAVRTWSIGVTACKEWGERALLSLPCVMGLGMLSSASAQGLASAQPRSQVWAALGASARAHWWWTDALRLSLDVGVLVPISARPSFEVSDRAAQAGQVLAYAQLRAGLRIP